MASYTNRQQSSHGRCGSCDESRHSCHERCKRQLFCGHLCGNQCHIGTAEKCRPCESPCINRCSHSNCPRACKEPVRHVVRLAGVVFFFRDLMTVFALLQCASCVERCDWSCEHEGECPLVCGAPCTRLPCNRVRLLFRRYACTESTTHC